MPVTDICETCNKSSLSFLLLRPSPIAKLKDLAPPGSAGMTASDDLVNGLMPERTPTESKVVLRTLRPGYVYVHIEKPADGKHWLIFRVTKEGNIVPQSSSFFSRPHEPFACSAKGHNAEGLKLINIPRAHKISGFWIAFSANLWNDTIKKRNAANPRQMQFVQLDSPPECCFLPIADALRNRVLECRATDVRASVLSNQDFPFNRIGNVQNLADELHRAAAKHPKTAGKQLAIVLRDPVGFATELNALRLMRDELIKQEAAKKTNAHPLNSSATLMNIKHLIHKDAIESAVDSLCPVVSKKTFDQTISTSRQPRYAGAIWVPLPPDRSSISKDGTPMGRVWTAEARKEIHQNADKLKERNWARVASEYDDGARLHWLAMFQLRLVKDHYEPLARFEADWWAACTDPQFESYFAEHFDDNDPNSLQRSCSPGFIYKEEAARALTPAPLTNGDDCVAYANQLIDDIAKPSAILLKALAANQAEVIKAIAGINGLVTGAAHAHNERNDKLYDFSSSLIQMSGTPAGPHGMSARYSWLSIGLGDALGVYTLAIIGSFGGAVAAIGIRLGAEFFHSRAGEKMLRTLQNLQMVQRATDMAARSVVAKTALTTPILISKTYPLDEAFRILGGSTGTSLDELQRYTNNGSVKIELLTTADEMAAYADDIDNAVAQGAGRVTIEGQVPWILRRPPPERTTRFTDAQWERAIRARGKLGTEVAYWFRESGQGTVAVLKSVEGRLALGAVFINGVSLWANLSKVTNGSGSAKETRDAILGLIDSSASVVAGLTQTLEVAAKASVAGRLGESAVGASVPIHTLRAAGLVLGTFAGVVTTIGQFLKTHDAVKAKQLDAAGLYFLSGLSFAGLTAISGLAAAGAIADRLVAKRMAGVIAQRMALRYGAAGIAVIAGGSVQGWGLGLLAAAIVFEVGAVMLTPTEVQEWVQRSYFGYGRAKEPKFAIGDWAGERDGLKRLLPPESAQKRPVPRTEELS